MVLNLNINCSEAVLGKLTDKHNVSYLEIKQCFINIDGGFLEDSRDDHATRPITEWFIAETHKGRKLKICFVQVGTEINIKTAFEPNAEESRIYEKYAY